MITRDELRSIPSRYKRLTRDKAHLEYLREKATCIPSLSTGERVQNTVQNRAGMIIDAAVDLAREVQIQELEFAELMAEATEWIDTLEGIDRRLMKYRYIDHQTWDMTACLVGYTERHTRRMASAVEDTLPLT